jgi:hypothetical protein
MSTESKIKTLGFGHDTVKWKNNVTDALTLEFGKEVADFAMKGQLFNDSTQNMNKRHENTGRGSIYVANQMTGMGGKKVIERREITEFQYNRLKPEEADEIVIEEEEEQDPALRSLRSAIAAPGNNIIKKRFYRSLIIEMPIDNENYADLYPSDPFSPNRAIRYKVSQNMVEKLTKLEKEWVEGLHKACAAMSKYMETSLTNVLERDKRYVSAKGSGRIDFMIKLIYETVLKGAATEQVNQGNQKGRDFLLQLMTVEIGNMNTIVYLQKFDKLYQSLLLCGFNNEDRSTMEDQRSPFEYMLGQILMWSVKSLYSSEIKKCTSEELVSPNLHYRSAIAMIEKWMRERESTIAGELTRKSYEENPRKYTRLSPHQKEDHTSIAAVREYQRNLPEERPKKTQKIYKDGTGQPDPRIHYSLAGIKDKDMRDFIKRNICENCNTRGHMGVRCIHPDTTPEMIERSKEIRDKRRKEREEYNEK